MTIKGELGGSRPVELEGMNWLTQPDPHVHVFDVLENDTGERRWLSRIFSPQEAVLDHLRSSLLDCFPFEPGAVKPKVSTKRIWDRRILELSSDASLGMAGSTTLPLLHTFAGVQGVGKKSLILDMSHVSMSVVDKLILLDEHLAVTAPVSVSDSFIEKLQTGRVYVVIAVYVAESIRLLDSAAMEAGTQAGGDNVVTGMAIDGSGGLARSTSVYFDRKASGDAAAFGIKVRQVNFNVDKRQYYLGKVQRAKIRGYDEHNEAANWISDIDENVLLVS